MHKNFSSIRGEKEDKTLFSYVMLRNNVKRLERETGKVAFRFE